MNFYLTFNFKEMKQTIIILLLIAFSTFFKNAYSVIAIVESNCTEFNGICLGVEDGTAEIVITVDFLNAPRYIVKSNWSVEITTNIDSEPNYIIDKSSFTLSSGKYQFTYDLNIPIFDNQIIIHLYLMSENHTTIWAEDERAFDICASLINDPNSSLIFGNPRLSNPLDQILVDKTINGNANFDSYVYFDQDKIDNNRIYPNPTKMNFTMEYFAIKDEEVNFSIYDTSGRKIYETSFIHHDTGLYSKYFNDLKLSKGIYYCKIHSIKFQNIVKVQKL